MLRKNKQEWTDVNDLEREFPFPDEFKDDYVRMKDIMYIVQKDEMKQRHRLGFQLEFVFLLFFMPLVVYWGLQFESVTIAQEILTKSEFPVIPYPNGNVVATKSFLDGFSD